MSDLRCSCVWRHAGIVVFAVLLFGFGARIEAQDYTTKVGTPAFTTAEPVEMGFVNVPNGNLHIEIPLISLPQRGSLAYSARLVYDSRIWQPVTGTSTTWQPTNVANSMAGWRLMTGAETGNVTSHGISHRCDDMVYYTVYWLTWTDPYGTTHDFFPGTIRDKNSACQYDKKTGDAFANDSSGYHLYVTNYYTGITIYAPNGNQVYPTVKDTNGNYFSTDANGNIVDTTGRVPLTVTNNADGTITYGVLNPSGSYSPYTLTKQSISVNTNFGQSGITESSTTITGVQSLSLPDGTSYSFTYDSGTTAGNFGELKSVKLPTNVVVNYSYTTFADAYGTRNRWISGRTVDTITGSWSYTPQVLTTCPQDQTGCTQQVTVGKPNGDQTIYSSFLNNGAWVSRIQHIGANGPVTTDQTWDTSNSCGSSCTGAGYVRKTSVNTSIPSGPNFFTTKSTTYVTDRYTGLTSETAEYDYGPDGVLGSTVHGGLLRKTLTTYALYNRPYQVTVQEGATLATVAQTTHTYDTGSLQPSGATQLQTPTTARGNVTGISQLVATGSTLNKSISYYDTGLPYQVTDVNNAVTSYNYGYCNGSLPSSVILPVFGATNPQSFTWNCNCHAMLSSTDINGQTTSYKYEEPNYCRNTEVDYPDGGSVKTTYNLTASPFNISTVTAVDGTSTLVSKVYFDGLGRTEHTESPNPSGTVSVNYTYDALGRVSTATNPHFSSASSSDGTTQYAYDVLGRVSQVVRPDSNIAAAIYSRNSVTSADEAGRQRKLTYDGIGRLTAVTEPDPSSGTLNVLTSYGYNALGNLTSVNQSGSRARAFTYDGLGRITSESNPESGLVTYTYDSDSGNTSKGDLVKKVAPKANQTGSDTTTATYTYDSLHRLTTKSYSDPSTPGISYYYDLAAPFGVSVNNPKGRLVAISYTSGCGTCTVFDYDSMGRLVKSWHGFPGMPWWAANYSHNLDGSLSSLSYPSGRVVKYGYSQGALNSVKFDTYNGTSVGYNYYTVSDANFLPSGIPYQAQFGDGLYEMIHQNSRLQVDGITVANTVNPSSGAPAFLQLGFGLYDQNNKNNGNIWSVTDSLSSSRSQTFSYDQVNRLTSAQQGTAGFNQQFTYDIWGNLTKAADSNGIVPGVNTTANTNNRLSGFDYDAAGNLIKDGLTTFQYDAENRIVNIGSGSALNAYGPDGTRVEKQVGGAKTDYISIGGQVIAEYQNGQWSDYIYAGGRRIAKADDSKYFITTQGTNCSNCGWQSSEFHFPNSVIPYHRVVQQGDKLVLMQWESVAQGGPSVGFTDGTWTGMYSVPDQNGIQADQDTIQGQWHSRIIDLSSMAGKAIENISLITQGTTSGRWIIDYADMAYVAADGTVWSIYNGGAGDPGLSVMGSPQSSRYYFNYNETDYKLQWATLSTQYYHGDHLGSARLMTNYGGYPVWQGTFAPYGYEIGAQKTTNHYKFTGQERDGDVTSSDMPQGLDHFPYRDYASQLGRWMQADPAGLSAVSIYDPRTWNRYTYVLNSPLTLTDPYGLVPDCEWVMTTWTTPNPDPNGFPIQHIKWVCVPKSGNSDGALTDPFEIYSSFQRPSLAAFMRWHWEALVGKVYEQVRAKPKMPEIRANNPPLPEFTVNRPQPGVSGGTVFAMCQWNTWTGMTGSRNSSQELAPVPYYQETSPERSLYEQPVPKTFVVNPVAESHGDSMGAAMGLGGSVLDCYVRAMQSKSGK